MSHIIEPRESLVFLDAGEVNFVAKSPRDFFYAKAFLEKTRKSKCHIVSGLRHFGFSRILFCVRFEVLKKYVAQSVAEVLERSIFDF